MRIVKFILLWIVLTVVMMVSWSFGITVGNVITRSSPPLLADPSSVAIAFLAVCIVNSLLVSLLVLQTHPYAGVFKWMALVLYVWVVQFLLTQMETWFFVEAMSTAQIFSIVVAGAVMALVTVSAGILMVRKMSKADPTQRFRLSITRWSALWLPLLALTVVIYPLIYFIFGYFVAWQSESVRIFYTHSAALDPFFESIAKGVADGVYTYQILRAAIWIIVSVPLIVMLRKETFSQYLLVAALSALPSVQLFIPNPYMPADVAMAHFVETSISNFLWGLCMVLGVNWMMDNSKLKI